MVLTDLDREWIRAELRGLAVEGLGLPTILTMERAARELSVGRSTLASMARQGVVATCIVNRRKMIPASEVLRLMRDKTVAPKRGRPAKKKAEPTDARGAAERLRKVRF